MPAENGAVSGERRNGLRARLTFGTALATTLFFGGYGARTAFAGSCEETFSGSGIFECSGPVLGSDTPQDLFGEALSVTTTSGFGINTANPAAAANESAIYLFARSGVTFLDENTSPITGFSGIRASNDGTGGAGGVSLTVTGTVAATGTTGSSFGIYATSFGGDITIKAADVTSTDSSRALSAGSFRAGSISITAANVSGAGTGIYAVKSEFNPIDPNALSITTTGQVTGVSGNGIEVRQRLDSGSTDVTIKAAGVYGGENGIVVEKRNDGALSITTTGQVTGGAGNGIDARNYQGTALTIDAAAVSGGNNGISAYNRGSDALSITATGAVEGAGAFGIEARNYGRDLTIEAAGASGKYYGIAARNTYGSGAVRVTTTGQVAGREGIGIDAVNGGEDGTEVSVEDVTGASRGIVAIDQGAGDLVIEATGTVTGDEFDAILADNASGSLSVTVSGVVTGGTNDGQGIDTFTRAGYSSAITLNAGADVGTDDESDGIAISNNSGDSTVMVNTDARVSGRIVLGDGSDSLTFDGGDFSGVTEFNGGANTGVDQSDTLAFRNVTGTVDGATAINWETVVIGTGGNISVSGALGAEVKIEDGGVLGGAGSIGGNLSVASGGSVGPGNSPGTMVVAGDFGLANGATLDIEIEGDGTGEFDLLQVGGEADFAAGSIIDFAFAVPAADLFDGFEVTFLTAEAITGFADIVFNFLGLGSDYTASVGFIDGVDTDSMFVRLSEVTGTGNGDPVPEPGMLGLLGAGLLGLFGLARRRRLTAAA